MSLFNKKISYSLLAKKLVNTYPDSIEIDDFGNLDYDNTVYNFACQILNNFDMNRQKYNFGTTFDGPEDCESWIRTHLQDLYELCDSYAND